MNIVVTGAHIDDPESGCGGLAVRAARAGHRVIFMYFSSGDPDREIADRPEDQIREAEGRAACAVLGTEPYFLRFPARDIPFSQAAVQRTSDVMRELKADLVLAHWPVDTHPDHQAAGILATQTVVGNPGVALAYYEVITGMQTLCFEPNRFVDTGETAPLKRKAIDCFVSQGVDGWWKFHDRMELFRGDQLQVSRAEAYYLAVATPEAETLFTPRNFWAPSGSRTLRKSKHENVPLRPV
jgi:N-acetylglucosamine malate deacetylase 1